MLSTLQKHKSLKTKNSSIRTISQESWFVHNLKCKWVQLFSDCLKNSLVNITVAWNILYVEHIGRILSLGLYISMGNG